MYQVKTHNFSNGTYIHGERAAAAVGVGGWVSPTFRSSAGTLHSIWCNLVDVLMPIFPFFFNDTPQPVIC